MRRQRTTIAIALLVVASIVVVALSWWFRTSGTRSSELARLRSQHRYPALESVDVQTEPCDQWIPMGHAKMCAEHIIAISEPRSTNTATGFEVDLPNATMVVLQQPSTNETQLLSTHHPTHEVLRGHLPSDDALRAMSPQEFDAFRRFAEATWLTASEAKQIVWLRSSTYSGVLFVHEQPMGRSWATATLWSNSGTSIDGVSFRPKGDEPIPEADEVIAVLGAYRMQ